MESIFEKELKRNVLGEVYFDSMHRTIYSVDASIYEIEPIGILLPKSKEDIVNAIKIAATHGISIIPRGAATGITGGCLGKGLIIDHSRYLNQIESVDFHEKYAICQPGVVQDNLNKVLGVRDYRLGPDTSTGDRATLGGMMANNAAGARSLYYGKMVDHVIGIELVLASGEVLYFQDVDEVELKQKMTLETTEGHIYREVVRIRDHYHEDILQHFPQIPRHVSGYNLDELLKPGPLNICKLITGSEGTLGIATQIKVNIMPIPQRLGLCLLFFHTLQESLETLATITEYHPLSLEMLDDQIILRGRDSPSMRGKLEWLKGDPAALLIVEFQATSMDELQDKIHTLMRQMQNQHGCYEQLAIVDEKQMQNVWSLRKAGLGLLLSKRAYSRAIAFIEDLSIHPKELPAFMKKFQAYLKSKGKSAGIYGHVGAGCMHVRPYIDLTQPDELLLMKKMMEDVSDMVLEHHGALSGEHGDGIIRTWLNKKMYGEKIYQAFQELKRAFDPQHLMNPGKIVEGQSVLENLRLSPAKSVSNLKTFLNFSSEGGFELAVDLCNGNGLCRKSEGTMCPSFQATENEYDSTRARAQALREMIHSQKPLEKFTEPALYDVLDLCIQCKGCKTECPSQVDMAKMKTEFLYHYHQKHGVSLRTRLFAHLSTLFSLGSKVPRLTNFFLSNRFFKRIWEKLGITSHRNLPQLTESCFSKQNKSSNKSHVNQKKVVLFNDTYTEFISPEIGIAAVQVLEALEYEVIIPPWSCCGRPLISKGFLIESQKKAEALIELLLPYAQQEICIVGIEPSCILTLIDDYPSLITHPQLHTLLNQCMTFDQFINRHIVDGKLPFPFKNNPEDLVKYHLHCYQKSLIGPQPTEHIFKAISTCDASEIKSGCCGMAGSFGYEKEHYDISMRIGNLKLFPKINQSLPGTRIVANGFSCRSQIFQGTGQKAEHLAEYLSSLIITTKSNES